MRRQPSTIVVVGLGLAALAAASADERHRPGTRVSGEVVHGSSGPAGSLGGLALNLVAPSSRWIHSASPTDGRVFIVDATTGREIHAFGAEKGIQVPVNLAVAANGDIYYTDLFAGFVGRIVLGASPPASTVMVPVTNPAAAFIPLPYAIALSDDETHLYVGSCFAPPPIPNLIYDIDLATGTVSPVSGPGGPVGLPRCSFGGMTYRDGFLYGAQSVTGDILRVGPVDVPFQAQVSPVAPGQLTLSQCPNGRRDFISPSAVSFDSRGQLYVVDAHLNQLRVIADPTGTCQPSRLVATLPGVGGAAGVAVDTNHGDRVFVSSAVDGYILDVSNAVFVKKPGLVLPLGIAAAGHSRLYVGDYSTLRTVDTRRRAVTNSVTQTIEGFLDGTGVAAPFTVATFGRHLVLADWIDQLIQVYDQETDRALVNIDTRPLTTGTPAVPLGSPLNAIEYAQLDGRPTIVAAHFRSADATSRLVRYSGPGFATHDVLASYAGRRFTGMASRGSRYWVADAITGAIFEFDDNGIGAEVATGLSNPLGLAVWHRHLLVIEGGPKPRLSAIRLSDGVSTVIEYLPALQPSNPAVASSLVPGIAVEPETGDVYFSSPGNAPGGQQSASRTVRRITSRELERLLR